MPGPSLIITADDRTGAIESAAACADAGWRAEVVPWDPSGELPRSRGDCVVIDLRSRHVAPEEAQRRVSAALAATLATGPARHAHKIDSALRGNWAEELAALAEEGNRVVLIPSHPELGRIAVGGVVMVGGVPVGESEHATDPRHPVATSRPADRLPGAELNDARALQTWLTGWERVAIVDATTIDEIDELVTIAAAADNVVLGGPAAVIGSLARVLAVHHGARPLPEPLLPAPVVAACASMHSTARSQASGLAMSGVRVVLSSEQWADDAVAVAAEVARTARQAVSALEARSVILIGGDTAEAFLGDSVVEVFGSVAPGIAVGEAVVDGRHLRVLTKPGSFGTPNTLVDLVKQHAKREQP